MRISPGAATDCRRDATFTMSPSGPLARSPARSPVTTTPLLTPLCIANDRPVRASKSGRISSTAAWRSSAARTARSASSSWTTGSPNTASTASPINLSMRPPYFSDDLARSLVDAAHQLANDFRIEVLGHLGVARRVGEQDRDLPPLLGAGCRRAIERRRALRTETRVGKVRGATPSALPPGRHRRHTTLRHTIWVVTTNCTRCSSNPTSLTNDSPPSESER